MSKFGTAFFATTESRRVSENTVVSDTLKQESLSPSHLWRIPGRRLEGQNRVLFKGISEQTRQAVLFTPLEGC